MRVDIADAPPANEPGPEDSFPNDAFISYDHDDRPVACELKAGYSGYVVRVLKHRMAQQLLAFPISGPTLSILDVSRSLAMNKR
jgi:hypothetical protein